MTGPPTGPTPEESREPARRFFFSNPIFKKWWLWTLTAVLLIVVIAAIASASSKKTSPPSSAANLPTATTAPPPTTAPPATTLPSTTTAPTAPPTTAPTTTAPPSPVAGGIQVGPGPLATYTIQSASAPGSCHYRYAGAYPLPDPTCTPGATNPQVTQADIGSTICASGYTSRIRPPESITAAEKEGSAAAYGYTGSFSTGEYDHLIPLEVGGDPNDPANLWVEPNDNSNAISTYNTKDKLENKMRDLVCSGELTLGVAQKAIATNWVAAYQQYDS